MHVGQSLVQRIGEPKELLDALLYAGGEEGGPAADYGQGPFLTSGAVRIC
jgi:hypothetical protein